MSKVFQCIPSSLAENPWKTQEDAWVVCTTAGLGKSACTTCTLPWLGRTNTICLGGSAACLGMSAYTAYIPSWLGTSTACLGKSACIACTASWLGRTNTTCLGITNNNCLGRSTTCLGLSCPSDLMKSSCWLDVSLSLTTNVLFQRVYQLLNDTTECEIYTK